MTHSEHRAFVAGLKAADLIAKRKRNWFRDLGADWRVTGGIDRARDAIRDRIQRESRKLKAKGKRR